MVFRHLKKRLTFVYGNNNALLEISSAHNFGACTNVSCFVCFGVFVPLVYLTHIGRSNRLRAPHFDLYSARVAIEQ